jgi:hypothetical protein
MASRLRPRYHTRMMPALLSLLIAVASAWSSVEPSYSARLDALSLPVRCMIHPFGGRPLPSNLIIKWIENPDLDAGLHLDKTPDLLESISYVGDTVALRSAKWIVRQSPNHSRNFFDEWTHFQSPGMTQEGEIRRQFSVPEATLFFKTAHNPRGTMNIPIRVAFAGNKYLSPSLFFSVMQIKEFFKHPETLGISWINVVVETIHNPQSGLDLLIAARHWNGGPMRLAYRQMPATLRYLMTTMIEADFYIDPSPTISNLDWIPLRELLQHDNFPGAKQNKGQSDITLLERYPKLQRSLRVLGIDSLAIDVPYRYTLRVRCLKSQSQTYREGAGLIDAGRLQRESFLAAAG